MTDSELNPADWMRGFPPDAPRIIRFADGSYYSWPQLRWSFSHMEQLVPTKAVWRGAGAARELPTTPRSFDHIEVGLADGTTLSWTEMLVETNTDALAILHKGTLVYEQYFGACGPHDRHTIMSCNKSMVGLIAECLIDADRLDDGSVVSEIVPELAGTAWADATVRQVLDMVIGMKFDEDYLNPESDVWRFVRSTGMTPSGPSDHRTIADFLPTVVAEGSHGDAFAYREPNVFVLGWIVRRAAKQDLTSLASELVWQHIGAEHDWLYMVDASGAETTAAATLRDFIRFGDLVCSGGAQGSTQVVPRVAVESIMAGGNQAAFAKGDNDTLPDWSYRSHWWIRHIDGRVCPVARGAHGQLLYVDPANDLVIARFGSAPQAPMSLLDPILLPTIDAITAEVVG